MRKQLPMYSESTALFPSIYFGTPNASGGAMEGGETNRAMVTRTVTNCKPHGTAEVRSAETPRAEQSHVDRAGHREREQPA